MALLFAVPAYCGHGRIFWEDEMLGWMLLRDPSWKHMLLAWRHGADGGGMAFYLLGRLWFAVFGASVMSFRKFSAAGYALAAVLAWATMRRFYTAGVTCFALLSVWLVSPLLVQYMTFGRFYGLLMAGAAGAMSLAVLYSTRDKLRPVDYAAVFCVHAVLTTTHQLGAVYSFAAIVISVVLDRRRRRWRPGLYAAAALSWLLLLWELPSIAAAARVGKPHFWTMQPRLYEFALMYTAFSPLVALLLALLAGFVVWRGLARTVFAGRAPMFVTCGALFAIPVLLYIEGWFGPVLCVGRYLQPVALGTTIALAEAATLALALLPTRLSVRPVRVAAWAVFIAVLLAYDFAYRSRHTTLHRDYTAALTRALPAGVPVVCEDAFAFTELMSRQHDAAVRYTYLLDWANAVSHQAPRVEVTQYHLMKNWKNVGYFSGSIKDAVPFLEEHPFFYTISFRDAVDHWPLGRSAATDRSVMIGSGLHRQLAVDPRYLVSLEREVPLGELSASLWRVCRKDAGTCGDGR